MFVLEHPSVAEASGRKPVATLLGTDIRLSLGGPGAQAQGLARSISQVLEEAGVLPSEVWAVCTRNADKKCTEVENTALAEVFGTRDLAHRFNINHTVGGCFSAEGAFQLSSLLALFEQEKSGGRYALVTSAGTMDGTVGCVLIGRA
jgi:hypothetical protein